MRLLDHFIAGRELSILPPHPLRPKLERHASVSRLDNKLGWRHSSRTAVGTTVVPGNPNGSSAGPQHRIRIDEKGKNWCRRGESECSGALKTRKLLVFRDAKNGEHGRIGPNWNVSGTRDFHFSCQFCGVAGWAALRSSSISARTGSGAADNTRSLSSYPVARTRLEGSSPGSLVPLSIASQHPESPWHLLLLL